MFMYGIIGTYRWYMTGANQNKVYCLVCELVYVWYNMNYEILIYCSLVSIEIQFIKIYFFKIL